MCLGIVRMGIAVWLAGCFCHAVCQTNPSSTAPQAPSDYSLYSAFFERVAMDARFLTSNELPADAPKPDVQDSAGLTDREMKALDAIAADCHTRVGAVYPRAGQSVFDALIEAIQSGKDTSVDVQQMLKDRDGQRERIVLDHVQQLRAAFGDARFQELSARLRAEEASRPRAPVKK
jgi:hypothetical protein